MFEVALASAMFHTEDYAGAIGQLERAIETGAPFGPVLGAYLIASYYMVGDEHEATRLADLFEQIWPDAQVLPLKRRLFTSPEPVDQLAHALNQVAARN